MNRAQASMLTSAAVALASCVASPPKEMRANSPVTGADRIIYAIGACRGFCASYTFAIAADGRSEFVGERHTSFIGKAPAPTNPRHFEQIAAALAPIAPVGNRSYSRENCARFATDQQVITVTWSFSNRWDRTLQFDLGCHDDSLASVREALVVARRLMPIDNMVGQTGN